MLLILLTVPFFFFGPVFVSVSVFIPGYLIYYLEFQRGLQSARRRKHPRWRKAGRWERQQWDVIITRTTGLMSTAQDQQQQQQPQESSAAPLWTGNRIHPVFYHFKGPFLLSSSKCLSCILMHSFKTQCADYKMWNQCTM